MIDTITRTNNAAEREPVTWIGQAFANRAEVERAYQMLLERGYDESEINLLMSEKTQQRFLSEQETESALTEKAQEGTLSGAGKGAMKGAVIGTLLALGSNMVLPGIGLFLGGPLFIGGGAIIGGLNNYLVDSGIPEEQATAYENDIKNGRIVLGVRPHDDEDVEYLREAWGYR